MIIALQALYLFRNSIISIVGEYLEPYFSNVTLCKDDDNQVEDDKDDDVFAEYDQVKGVVFYPPVYAQRYAAVTDCLLDDRWCGKLEKVVDFGCNDMSFVRYLKDVEGVKDILGVDLEAVALRCTADLKSDKYSPQRENPLKISLLQGNAADPDYRLIGCDAVIAIEVIEHMLPHDLDRFVHNVFGFIRPWIAVITTPNQDFNWLFKNLEKNGLRRLDHFFEWTREQFHDWCSNIVSRYPQYTVTCRGVGPGPPGTSQLGCCSQLALFVASDYHKQPDLNVNSLSLVARVSSDSDEVLPEHWDSFEGKPEHNELITLCAPNRLNCSNLQVKKFSKATHKLMERNKVDFLINSRAIADEIRSLSLMLNFNESLESSRDGHIWNNTNWGENAPYWNQYYKSVRVYKYPFEIKSEDSLILEVISDAINHLVDSEDDVWLSRDKVEIPLDYLMKLVQHITSDEEKVRDLLDWNGYDVVGDVVVYSRLVLSEALADDWVEVETTSDVNSL